MCSNRGIRASTSVPAPIWPRAGRRPCGPTGPLTAQAAASTRLSCHANEGIRMGLMGYGRVECGAGRSPGAATRCTSTSGRLSRTRSASAGTQAGRDACAVPGTAAPRGSPVDVDTRRRWRRCERRPRRPGPLRHPDPRRTRSSPPRSGRDRADRGSASSSTRSASSGACRAPASMAARRTAARSAGAAVDHDEHPLRDGLEAPPGPGRSPTSSSSASTCAPPGAARSRGARSGWAP